MRYLPDGDQMKNADTHTIRQIGIPSLVLMERAALKIVESIEQADVSLSDTLVVCEAETTEEMDLPRPGSWLKRVQSFRAVCRKGNFIE